MKPTLFSSLACALFSLAHADSFLVEAEQFSQKGGWMVDTQFIETMGSPYLIAHGMGKPVADATTAVNVPGDGNYQVWVRTIDWTKRLKRNDSAGTFSVSVNGKDLGTVLGQGNTAWSWVKAGKVDLKKGQAELALKDLTGFDGRVDAILFSSEASFTPPEKCMLQDRSSWKIAGAPAAIEDAGTYDLVVVGGGYGGMGAAISAARLGAKVALIQNRKVLGGNGSSEVRVWAKGDTPPSEYALSDIVNEFQDDAKASPAPAEQFEDEKKEKIVRAEKNITLFLGHHAYGLDLKGGAISAVNVLEVESGKNKKISGVLFADCTGHGFIGQWAKADSTMEEKGRMGMSNMWMWENRDKPVAFPPQKWMLSLTEKDFPHPRRGHAEWFWESGFDRHPIEELEITRDWNLISAYSAFSAMKNYGAHSARDPQQHANADMVWLAYVGGTRETQQLLGDVILSGANIEKDKTVFPDGCVLTTWSIDLHIPEQKYVQGNPEHPFISKAIHRHAIDKRIGYPIPYRCFYSRNVPNLFMAGRNISVDRDALGTIRVMNTIGMMGVCVGRSAALCRVHDCLPRDIYAKHLDQAKHLWKLPGKERFASLTEMKKALPTK
jgi:hypothetical protein